MNSSFGSVDYCIIMSAKRNLPAWMVASEEKSGKEEQLRESLKRKPEVKATKSVRKKGIKRMIYWMNERELMETALSVIKRHNGETAAADRCAPLNTEMTVIPETDHEETTDSEVSEPAVDIAEQKKVPYSKFLEERWCSSASESSGEQPLASSAVLEKEAESEEDNSQSDSDSEALQVLREIFFS
ncbi:uncharacterized protein si:ch211-127m7.2 [Pangasianodon hypophthalmus]|uniref:uncharacterized protein si:ch211-127m7.2 n=1 Tax=Pangasianodon hypophthalmus TaxID=310915 RepID=UPI002307E9E5|nr:uncharacterized protein si:ch211-127m7.2 [Pangasianodon hypophthalmus]XP_034161872.2 uncharacterized protein si:ch211-127m7.2 [Pangasianodon hypophthalmus]XP_034161873.2 uncharacterized protein si:ch211-127m7.2 [Pangasianodon hypophthalmus]